MYKFYLLLALLRGICPQIDAQKSAGVVDSSRVRILLDKSSYYADNIEERASFMDSALLACAQAEELSRALRFNDGIIKSFFARAYVYINSRNLKIAAKKDFKTEESAIAAEEGKIASFAKNQMISMNAGEAYVRLGDSYSLATVNFVDMIRSYELAIPFFQKAGNKKRESEVLYKAGFIHNRLGNLEKAQQFYLKSIDMALASGDRRNLSKIYGTLGNTYTWQADYKTGLKYQLEALRMAEAEKDTSTAFGVINLYLGLTYEALKENQQASQYYQAALLVFEKYPETNMGDLTSCIFNTGKMILYKDPKAAIEFVESYLRRFPSIISHNNYRGLQTLLLSANMKLKEYGKAQVYCDQILKTFESLRPLEQRGLLPTLIQYFIASKQYDEATKYLPRYKAISEETKDLSNLRSAHLYWARLDSAQGNFQSALTHYVQFKAFEDSLFNQGKAKEMAQLQIQYETEKKDRDIKLKERDIDILTKQGLLQAALNQRKDQDLEFQQLQIELLQQQKDLQLADVAKKDQDMQLKDQDIQLKEQNINLLRKESLLQQSRLQETKATRNYMIAGAVMLFLLLGLGYNRYQIKHRSNREINAKNHSLQRLVEEKEWLLKEVHHRVKNNLQTIVSLLESQSAYLQNDALIAIQDSQNRVHAMSLIHQKLYHTENVASINMAAYLPELVNYLRDSFNVHSSIRFQLEIAPVELDVSQAVPVGLITNEAITNSIKYAFKEGAAGGTITVALAKMAGGRIALEISDNGIGLPRDHAERRSGGLGLKLIEGLTEDIGGQCIISAEHGTKISITFIATVPLRNKESVSDSLSIAQIV